MFLGIYIYRVRLYGVGKSCFLLLCMYISMYVFMYVRSPGHGGGGGYLNGCN